MARSIRPSTRGEPEITDVNNRYLEAGKLNIARLGRSYAWLDVGMHASLLEASASVRTIELRQGVKIACLKEIAYDMGYIDAEAVQRRAELLGKTEYARYLERYVGGTLMNCGEMPA